MFVAVAPTAEKSVPLELRSTRNWDSLNEWSVQSSRIWEGPVSVAVSELGGKGGAVKMGAGLLEEPEEPPPDPPDPPQLNPAASDTAARIRRLHLRRATPASLSCSPDLEFIDGPSACPAAIFKNPFRSHDSRLETRDT